MSVKEVLHGPLFMGPGYTQTQSHANQWAGRSVLNSGSATLVISTAAVKSDSLIHLGLEGNANFGIIAGVANINSGAASVTVSNAAVTDTSLILAQAKQNGAPQSSGVANRNVEVVSLANGWFSLGWSDGGALSARQTPVAYVAYPADGPPANIEVKTISDSGYFTLGRSDGRAAGRNTSVLWQITKTHHR